MEKKFPIRLISAIVIICIMGLITFLYFYNGFSVNYVKREKTTESLTKLNLTYHSVGYGSLCVNKDSLGNKLSLLSEGKEKEFDYGFFAHAYSVLVFDNLKDLKCSYFSTYMGINKSARGVAATSIEFYVYFDQELVYSSGKVDKSSEMLFFEKNIDNKVSRITLVIDDLGGNGSDHGVWADPIITYMKEVEK